MNLKKFKEYLSHKTWLWKRVFWHFYLAKHSGKMQRLREQKEHQDNSVITALCRDENDLNEFWRIAKDVEQREETLIGTIEDLRYCHPLSWQYDFVDEVSKKLNINLLKSLKLSSLADAYCLAVINGIDTNRLIADLDGKYRGIFASASRKVNLLRRNFSLILETKAPRLNENNVGLNFREITESYVSQCGISGIIDALKQARTPETKLTSDEVECLCLAYYSPYSDNNRHSITPNVPGCTVAQCVIDQLEGETSFIEYLHTMAAQISLKNDDDDDSDEAEELLKKMLAVTHHPIYVDPTEHCLIDVQRTTSPFYAHVYIEKFPQDDLNNSLPDFIRYHKGWLYTVEFVDDIKMLEVTREMNMHLNFCKHEIIRLEKSCNDNPGLALDKVFRKKYDYLNKMLQTFYCINS